MQINTSIRNQIIDVIDAHMDTGSNPECRWTNTAVTAAYATAPLSTTNVFSAPTASATTLSLNGTATSTTEATGTATRLAFYINGTAAIGTWDMLFGIDTTATPTTPDVTMPDNSIESTDTVKLTSLTISVPAGSPTV